MKDETNPPDSDKTAGCSESQVFLDKLNRGSDSALETAFQRYYQQLCDLAARRMGKRIAAEPESIAMSVIGSIIRGLRERRFHVGDARRLWSLMMTILLHKIWKRADRDRRLVSAEVDLTSLLAQGPSPDDIASFQDLVESLLVGLESPYREVLALRLEGCTQHEIAERLGLTVYQVQKTLERLEDRLRRMLERFERDE